MADDEISANFSLKISGCESENGLNGYFVPIKDYRGKAQVDCILQKQNLLIQAVILSGIKSRTISRQEFIFDGKKRLETQESIAYT